MKKNKVRSGREEREERERIAKLRFKYTHRITIAKNGKEFFDARDYGNALTKFIEYLKIMVEIKEVQDYYALTPSHFDSKADVAEMMMISHIFLEMSRIYDASPKFSDELNKCINQFVAFTINQRFQVVNSEMLRKYLKKAIFKNPQVFKSAHSQIFVQSKKCYIVTYCYGSKHPVTDQYREFKDILLVTSMGKELVRIYYKYSSSIIENWGDHFLIKSTSVLFIKPCLGLFSKIILPLIIKKC